MNRFILLFALVCVGPIAFPQSNLPIIKASAKTVHIRDGNHFKKNFWYIMPERKPDYYFVEIPEKPHRVIFITDLDSISFDTEYEKTFDFIILLNGKDSCYTRISATYKNLNRYTRKMNTSKPDTIPFVLGNNDKVYLKGILNGSLPLDIQFDLGAGGTLIKKSSVKKVKIEFDKTITLQNSDGTNQVPSSSRNLLEIGNLTWDSLDVAVADNMTNREDLIIGNSLFKNKVLEINYDKKILVIHDNLQNPGVGYSQHPVILDGSTVPFVEGSLTFKGKTQTGWMMLDIGAYTSILNSNDVSGANKTLCETRKMFGLNIEPFSPKISIGSYELSGFNYSTQKMKGDALQLLLGGDLLKRFNFILDNPNGLLYLKPNSFNNAPYRNPEYYVVRIAMGSLILLTVILIIRRRRRRKE